MPNVTQPVSNAAKFNNPAPIVGGVNTTTYDPATVPSIRQVLNFDASYYTLPLGNPYLGVLPEQFVWAFPARPGYPTGYYILGSALAAEFLFKGVGPFISPGQDVMRGGNLVCSLFPDKEPGVSDINNIAIATVPVYVSKQAIPSGRVTPTSPANTITTGVPVLVSPRQYAIGADPNILSL